MYKEFVSAKIKDISKEGIVLDVGGGDRFTKWLREYKDFFRNCDYKTMDYDSSTGADIVGDIHSIPLKDESVDGIICNAVLEHVNDPIRAVQEMHRVMKRGGKIFIYVPSIYPYHARKGHYPDMWRFFDDSINFLCKDFSSIEICKLGGYFKAMSYFLPFQHKFQWLLVPLTTFLDSFINTGKRNTTAGYYIYAVK